MPPMIMAIAPIPKPQPVSAVCLEPCKEGMLFRPPPRGQSELAVSPPRRVSVASPGGCHRCRGGDTSGVPARPPEVGGAL
jgi:hypothetical protein